jgi:calcineurin-like phosphoesterase family protein
MQYGSGPIHRPNNIYALGDVHNEADKLQSALDQIEPLIQPNDHIVFTGDLINRGKNPAKTIELLVDLANRYTGQVFFVEGNHDWMLKNYLIAGNREWFDYLEPTLMALKEEWKLSDINPDTVMEALLAKGFTAVTRNTVPYYESDKVIVTHAPIDHNTALVYGIESYEEDYGDKENNQSFRYFLDRILDSIKWDFVSEDENIPHIHKFMICGHQPAHHKMPRIFKDRAFIDSGCGKGNCPLTCLSYPSKKFFQSKV